MTRSVLVVLFSVLPLGWTAEEHSSEEVGTKLHHELGLRHYDHALKIMALKKDIAQIATLITIAASLGLIEMRTPPLQWEQYSVRLSGQKIRPQESSASLA